jgi:hypothetical protein
MAAMVTVDLLSRKTELRQKSILQCIEIIGCWEPRDSALREWNSLLRLRNRNIPMGFKRIGLIWLRV